MNENIDGEGHKESRCDPYRGGVNSTVTSSDNGSQQCPQMMAVLKFSSRSESVITEFHIQIESKNIEIKYRHLSNTSDDQLILLKLFCYVIIQKDPFYILIKIPRLFHVSYFFQCR